MKWLTYVLLAVAAVLAGLLAYRQVAPPPVSGGEALDAPLALPAIALLDDQGKNTTLAAGDGRMRLIFYGYVRCPDVCPATLASLKNTYETLTPEQQKRVQVQFITVDPTFDRPRLVREYLDKFDHAFTGLTGTPEAINQAAGAMFVGIVNNNSGSDHSQMQMDNGAGPAVSASRAAIIHGDQVSVIDSQSRFVRVYANGNVINGNLERDLPGLLKEYGPP